MRVFQKLFSNLTPHINKPSLRVSNIKPSPAFFKIPYDEQYEPRDFVREDKGNKVNKRNKNDKDNEKEDKNKK